MYLKKLTISSKTGVVREIPFKKGLNLIVDKTTSLSTDSGNNVGKTTLLKIIDYCLGGNKHQIYTEKEFKVKNKKVLKTLEENKFIFSLELETKQGSTHTISRSIKGKSSIDNETMSSEQKFKKLLQEIIFNFSDTRPTLGQLMNKFIRVDKHQLENALFFLHDTADHSDYEALFMFLFGYRETQNLSKKRKLVDRIKVLKRELKENDYNTDELEQQIFLIDKDISELQTMKSNFQFKESVANELNSLKTLQETITNLKKEISKLNLKISLNYTTLNQLKKSKSNINVTTLKILYHNAKLEIGKLDRKFKEVVNFHNNMVNNKIVYIEKNVLEIQKNINKLKDELDSNLDKESGLIKLISNKEALGDYENLNLKLQDKNRDKGFKEGLIQNIRDIKLKLEKKMKECDKLNQTIDNFITDYKENLKEFNVYFSSYSEK
ncbi:MAG: AAA family ATPase, partial [Oligoflexia bacterium]|nr:AAA family ATPase [Oligoflexia bacterium]